MLRKLRGKFVWITMCIVLAMLLVIFTMVYQLTARDLRRQADSMLKQLAKTAQEPAAIYEKQDVALPYVMIRLSPLGDIVASGMTSYDLTDEQLLRQWVQQVYSQRQTQGQLEEYSMRYHRVSRLGSECIVMVDVSSHAQTLHSLIFTSLGIGAVSMIAFLIISILLARWAVKPVEQAWQAQKQFVSDASHELKTPLTVIISNAELLQDNDCSEEDRMRYARNIGVVSGQMRSLTQGLLELARVDNGQVRKNFEDLDFSTLVADAILPFEPLFFENNLQLQSSIQPQIRLMGSSIYLRQVVDILLDNALKYASPGIVDVKLERCGRANCLLSVASPGKPISGEEQEKIFERFYRSDKARTGNGSFGLGLSIAKSAVQEHKGRIWVQSNATGNCFYVLLPMH